LENGWLCPVQAHTFYHDSTIRQNIPDKKAENRRKCREAACVKIDKAKVDFCADFEYDIGTKVWWYQWRI
ncbi:MAG: hypothetical protein WAU97_08060, partial [Gemmiger qucibialis]